MKVLVADDCELIRTRIRECILNISVNITVYEACNGEEAMKIIKNEKLDMIILDIKMPKLNGLNVLKLTRKFDKEIEICILTNDNNVKYKEKSYREGANFFLNKSSEFNKLTTIVENKLHQ